MSFYRIRTPRHPKQHHLFNFTEDGKVKLGDFIKMEFTGDGFPECFYPITYYCSTPHPNWNPFTVYWLEARSQMNNRVAHNTIYTKKDM